MKAIYCLQLLVILMMTLGFSAANATQLQKVDAFGNNPGKLEMHIYTPTKLKNEPKILVALHYCSGDGPILAEKSGFTGLADQHGFIIIFPSAKHESKCFDVSTPEGLTRGGQGDATSLINMVRYTQKSYSVADKSVFAVGTSSGAMMTNVLLALYPDVFAAGASFSGVAFSCFATGSQNRWNNDCAKGDIHKSPKDWGDLVRKANPNFKGQYPRIQIWHGTADNVIHSRNLLEQQKQWSNVHDLEFGNATTQMLSRGPQSRYLNGKTIVVEVNELTGQGHGLYMHDDEVIQFFGLDK